MFRPQLQFIIQLDIADSAESVCANQSGSETAHKSCIKEPPCKCPMGGCRVTESYGLHFCALHAHAFAHGVNAPGTLWHRIEQRILIPGPKESNKGWELMILDDSIILLAACLELSSWSRCVIWKKATWSSQCQCIGWALSKITHICRNGTIATFGASRRQKWERLETMWQSTTFTSYLIVTYAHSRYQWWLHGYLLWLSWEEKLCSCVAAVTLVNAYSNYRELARNSSTTWTQTAWGTTSYLRTEKRALKPSAFVDQSPWATFFQI